MSVVLDSDVSASVKTPFNSDRTTEATRVKAPTETTDQTDPEHLVRRITRIIRRETNLGVQEMNVRFEDNKVIVTGYCRTFYTKQLVQQAVLSVLAEYELVNLVRVV